MFNIWCGDHKVSLHDLRLFLFLDNWGNAHELWWFFLSHLSTVFITEAMIMTNVDFIFPVSFFTCSMITEVMVNWLVLFFWMVPTSVYYVNSWQSDHDQCWFYFLHLFLPLPCWGNGPLVALIFFVSLYLLYFVYFRAFQLFWSIAWFGFWPLFVPILFMEKNSGL